MASGIERIRAFMAQIDEGVVDRVEPWEFGTALLSPSLRTVWDANYCRLEAPGHEAGELAAAAERVCGEAGLAHASVVSNDEADAERLRDGLQALGFEPARHVSMRLTAPPPPGSQAVEEISLEEVLSAEPQIRADEGPRSPEFAGALEEMSRRMHRAGDGRWFAVRAESGAIAARAWLLRDGRGIAQIEDVATAPAARGKGFARAVVSAAIRAGLDSGADLVFVVADADETTPELYLKLGFEPCGITTRFVRKPPDGG